MTSFKTRKYSPCSSPPPLEALSISTIIWKGLLSNPTYLTSQILVEFKHGNEITFKLSFDPLSKLFNALYFQVDREIIFLSVCFPSLNLVVVLSLSPLCPFFFLRCRVNGLTSQIKVLPTRKREKKSLPPPPPPIEEASLDAATCHTFQTEKWQKHKKTVNFGKMSKRKQSRSLACFTLLPQIFLLLLLFLWRPSIKSLATLKAPSPLLFFAERLERLFFPSLFFSQSWQQRRKTCDWKYCTKTHLPKAIWL